MDIIENVNGYILKPDTSEECAKVQSFIRGFQRGKVSTGRLAMVNPPAKCWSFTYKMDDARYSLEILAGTRDEAERRLKAAEQAICEGEIMPISANSPSIRG